jgi:hypothetical protein
MANPQRVTIDQNAINRYQQAGISGEYTKTRYGRGRTNNVQIEKQRQAQAAAVRESVTTIPRNNVVVGPWEGSKAVVDTTPPPPSQPARVKKKKKKRATAEDRAKAAAINATVSSWVWPLYLTVQLPLALLNVVFFAAAAVYLEILSVKENAGRFGKVFFGALDYVAEKINQGVELVTGLDIAAILQALAPDNLYLLTMVIIVAIFLFSALAIGLMYIMAGLNPLFGRGASLKIGTFIMCFVGYTMPLLNLLPWLSLWTLAVYRFPK